MIVGASGSGKTTVARILEEKYGLKNLHSYTTRPQRFEGETGHIFISEDEYLDFNDEEFCAFTEFNGYHYFATNDQVEKADIYIVDPDGVDYFKKHYKGKKKPIVFFLNTSKKVRKQRMKSRGDSRKKVYSRIKNDKKCFRDAHMISDAIINTDHCSPEGVAASIILKLNMERVDLDDE